MPDPITCCSTLVLTSHRFRDECKLDNVDVAVGQPRTCTPMTAIVDSRGCDHESVQFVKDYRGDESDVEEIYSSTRMAENETRINLRKAYMIKELEVEGYSVQSLEIGGNTRDFEVLPRNPLHRMGQRVHCLCSHVKKVRSACLGVDA
jgi:hypothetical protein